MNSTLDWQIDKSPLECTKYMLDHEINCDVNFRIGENPENIKAHKFILSMRSPVFERMFNGGFQESERDPVIPDVTPSAFQALLRYCYYECLDMEDDVALSVIYAAEKYMLPRLEEAARRKLIEVMSASNIWDIYKYAITVDDIDLIKRCETFFKGNITSVREAIHAVTFLTIPHKVLVCFLHLNEIIDDILASNAQLTNSESASQPVRTVPGIVRYQNNAGISLSEIELFKACDAWAKAECSRLEIDLTGENKRMVLGECLYKLRFPTMLFEDLVNIVYPAGILHQQEKDDLCQYKHKATGTDCQTDFTSTERYYVVTMSEPYPTISQARALTTSIVFIESSVRIMVSRIWVLASGSYSVTVRNETSDGCWSMRYNTKHDNHISTKVVDVNTRAVLLHYIDIKPQLLEVGSRYAIRAEKRIPLGTSDQRQITRFVLMETLSAFPEVKITRDPRKHNCIYALTLCCI